MQRFQSQLAVPVSGEGEGNRGRNVEGKELKEEEEKRNSVYEGVQWNPSTVGQNKVSVLVVSLFQVLTVFGERKGEKVSSSGIEERGRENEKEERDKKEERKRE